MKIDFATVLVNMEGKGLKERDLVKEVVDGKEVEKIVEKDLTLRIVTVNGLLSEAQVQGRQPIDGMEKKKRGMLADRIYGCKEPIQVDSEEITLIKNKISDIYPVLTTRRAWAVLEGEPQIPEDTTKEEATKKEDAPSQ
jgi:hypothetical protein